MITTNVNSQSGSKLADCLNGCRHCSRDSTVLNNILLLTHPHNDDHSHSCSCRYRHSRTSLRYKRDGRSTIRLALAPLVDVRRPCPHFTSSRSHSLLIMSQTPTARSTPAGSPAPRPTINLENIYNNIPILINRVRTNQLAANQIPPVRSSLLHADASFAI